ncbi:MAG TPA: hypothetical protein VJZ27_05825, partial [Aggregatilineales bacterium]|nr:hypothetical protein [Aggregatilineales bacterium]
VLLVLSPLLSQPASAQASVEDQVFAIVARNLGILPAPTKGQLDSGNLGDYPFPISYRTHGLDLNPSTGAPQCDSRVLGDEEVIIGWFGFRIVVTVQGRRYEFRTNSTGGLIIRCSGGQEVSMDFGAAASRGNFRSGWDVTDQAMRHLTGYLALETAITREAVDAAYQARLNGEENNFPYRVSYRWDSRIFTNSVLNCPASGGTWTNGDAAGYLMTISVDGRSYQYRASPDGSVLILCLGGRADTSSQGVTFAAES